MKKHITQKLFALFVATTLSAGSVQAQTFPHPALVGYWETWNSMKLTQINANYNVIDIAFAVTNGSSLYDMQMGDFSSAYSSKAAFIADIDALHAQKKTVILSIGGSADPVFLASTSDKSTFVSTINKIFSDYSYKFDGIDIDFETTSLAFGASWTMTAPAAGQQNIIDAVKEIIANYKTNTGKRLLLTMAPETAYIEGALSDYQITNINGGAYLPIIEALKNDIDMLHCQLYNATSNIAVDGKEYKEGSGDFLVAMSESVIKGYTLLKSKGTFSGLPASKVAFGLLACSTGGSGYVAPAEVCKAAQYIRGVIPKPSGWTYTLTKTYPDFGGMMDWDVNDDAGCGGSGFASNFDCAFKVGAGINEVERNSIVSIYPNPALDKLTIEANVTGITSLRIFNVFGQLIVEKQLTENKTTVDISTLSAGFYTVNVGTSVQKFIKQ